MNKSINKWALYLRLAAICACRKDASGLDVLIPSEHPLQSTSSALEAEAPVTLAHGAKSLLAQWMGEETGLLISRAGPEQRPRVDNLPTGPLALWVLIPFGALGPQLLFHILSGC